MTSHFTLYENFLPSVKQKHYINFLRYLEFTLQEVYFIGVPTVHVMWQIALSVQASDENIRNMSLRSACTQPLSA